MQRNSDSFIYHSVSEDLCSSIIKGLWLSQWCCEFNRSHTIWGFYTVRHISEIHTLEGVHHHSVALSLKYLYTKNKITLNLQKKSLRYSFHTNAKILKINEKQNIKASLLIENWTKEFYIFTCKIWKASQSSLSGLH